MAMSIHRSGRGETRRLVLSCDVVGCPVQVEPPPAEAWRRDIDADAHARAHADGWTHDPVRGTDYCPEHAESSTPLAEGTVAPRPSAAARDQAGDPLNRDDYAATLRAQLGEAPPATTLPTVVTRTQARVAARLLDELAGVYRGEALGTLATEMARTLDSHS